MGGCQGSRKRGEGGGEDGKEPSGKGVHQCLYPGVTSYEALQEQRVHGLSVISFH